MHAFLTEQGVQGATVLEMGGGVCDLQLEPRRSAGDRPGAGRLL
jgi:hypothetical protein